MSKGAPDLVALNHDEFDAKHVGKTADGKQFFLTTPFEPADENNPGCEFVALYLFDAQGKLLEARIDNLGPREQLDDKDHLARVETRLAELGKVTLGNIRVAPFRVERFNTEFGFIPQAPEEEGDEWTVTVEPGNFMMFYPPWDGDYDT